MAVLCTINRVIMLIIIISNTLSQNSSSVLITLLNFKMIASTYVKICGCVLYLIPCIDYVYVVPGQPVSYVIILVYPWLLTVPSHQNFVQH